MINNVRVKLNDTYCVSDENKDKIFIVIGEPKDLCGTRVIWLSGYGYYATDGLDVVE